MFAGSLFISSTPKPFRWISGLVIGWTSYYLFRRVVKICLPVVLKRLENIATSKSDPNYNWEKPVGINPKHPTAWIARREVLTYIGMLARRVAMAH